MKKYCGIAVSNGIAVGPVHLYNPALTAPAYSFDGRSVEEQLLAYKQAHIKAEDELSLLQARLENEQGAIFDAHREILNDAVIEEEIISMVSSGLVFLDEAIKAVYSKYASILGDSSNLLFQERARDMEDVCNRLLRLCTGVNVGSLACTEPCILAAKDLLPSDTATLDPKMILAIITEQGGPTSHTAIIARSHGIPAVLGVGSFLAELREGQTIAVDACQGDIFADIDKMTIAEFQRRANEFSEKEKELAKYLSKPAVTQDGVHIDINLNIASAEAKELSFAQYADGVGLFRTEFLFLGRQKLPSEEEQVAIYRKVLSAFQGKPVILRTLDIGGDKQASCLPLPHEENPFLGNRALRLCFTFPDVLKTQLRAALRASVAGILWLMFPMVGCLNDIRNVRNILNEVQRELDDAGIPYARNIKLGIMIEIPSIALLAEKVVQEVDFASIGSNDLCQYLMAADRMNPDVAKYYQPMNPAMFRLISLVSRTFIDAGKPISLCGELAGNPIASVVLVGMGMRKLSMNPDAIPRVKKLLCSISVEQAQQAACQVCALGTEQEVRDYLETSFVYE